MTYKLDLHTLPLDLHADIQARMSVRLAVRVGTDRHTHRRCQNYYTRHVTDVRCNEHIATSSDMRLSLLSTIPHVAIPRATTC